MLVNKNCFCSLAILSLLLTSACASQYRRRDDEAAKKIKTAAVIAFIVKEPASDKMSLNLNSGHAHSALGGSSFYQTSDETDQMYQDFTDSVSKTTGWKVLPRTTVAANGIYSTDKKMLMAPIQIMFLPKEGENWSMAHDIMVPKAAENAGRQGRTKMLNALGVDAVVVAEVTVSVKGGFSLNGMGPRRPQAHFDMKVYERDNDEPIWLEGVTGEKSEESLGWLGFIDEHRLKELSRVSAKSAFDRIGSEIK